MAWTTDDLDSLDRALLSGKKSFTFADGRKIEYHSLDEVRAVRREVKAELAAGASQVNPRRATVARVRRSR
ncbi:MAG TPA: hypothetical protein VMQ93_16270 [Novosphingobium sp.]|nr:hypothetical protein [Novosphingobium sp.]